MFKTKSFVENRWYKRLSPSNFQEIPTSETNEEAPIDTQVSEWVTKTGNIITHPGQLGMHTSWHGDEEDPYQMKCLTIGLTVLYREPSNDERDERAVQENRTVTISPIRAVRGEAS